MKPVTVQWCRTVSGVVSYTNFGHELKHTFELSSFLAKVSGISLRCKRSGAKFTVHGRLIKNRRLQIALHVVYDTKPETCVLVNG